MLSRGVRGRLAAALLVGVALIGPFVQASNAQDFRLDKTQLDIAGPTGTEQSATFVVTSGSTRALAAVTVAAPSAEDALPDAALRVTPDRAALVPGLPQVFRVDVTMPAQEGIYGATIEVHLVPDPDAMPELDFSDTLAVAVIATAGLATPTAASSPSPELAIVGTVKATRVSCTEGPDCALASLFLPKAEQESRIPILVQNTGAAPAAVASISVRAIGDRTRTELTDANLEPQPAPTVEPGAIGIVELGRSVSLPPDRYVGQIAMMIDGVTKPVTASLEFTVRQGPLLPLALLIAGLGVGGLLRVVRKDVLPKADAVSRLQATHRRIRTTPLFGPERAQLNGRAGLVQGLLVSSKLSAATDSMDEIDTALGWFDAFHALMLSLLSRKDDPAIEARAMIRTGRTCLITLVEGKPDFAGAETAYEAAIAKAASLDPAALAPGQEELPSIEAAGAASSGLPGRLRLMLFIRQPVRVILVILGVATGFFLLYASPTAGFIGNAPADNAALLLWGFGSSWVDKVFIDWG